MLRWLRSAQIKDDALAIAAALALCPLLWALKIHLAVWMRLAKGIRPLTDIPATSTPLLAAQDIVLCAGLAGLFMVFRLAAKPWWKPLRILIADVLPALIACAVALFAVLSWKVQQIYGCALEIAHIRAATGADTMGDSILAYLSAGTIAFLAVAIIIGLFGGRLLLRLPLLRPKWLRVRWRLWFLLFAVAFTWYALDKNIIKERYTYGIEQNAIIHFVRWYERAPAPVDADELLHDTPAQVVSRDAEFRRFAPFAPLLPEAHQPQLVSARVPGTDAHSDGPAMTPGLPLLEPRASAPRLNVLMILMESTPAMYIDRPTAPNLMRLADRGLVMDHHFTSVCETYKAVYSLFYSDYLVNLGSLPRAVYRRALPQTSLAQVLKSNGYQTAFYHSGFLRLGDLGFMLNGFETQVSADDLQKTGSLGWRYGVFEEHTVAALNDWICQHKSRPFFAVYSTMFPHHPYYCPVEDRPFDSETQVGRYRNALHYADQNVGKVLDLLDNENLTRDTLIVVVADHGETVSSWPCGHGMNFSMEELHVPLIFSNPRLFAPSTRGDLFTQHPDFAPTVLSLLGIQSPAEWLGRDLSARRVPVRAFPVKIEQAHFSGIIDNGYVYCLDEKSSRASLLTISGEQFVPAAADDPALALCPAYADRLSLFNPWVRWRHFQLVVGKKEPNPSVSQSAAKAEPQIK